MADAERPTVSYANSGVSIDAGNALVRAIAPMAKATARPGVMSSLGGFGALFDLKAAGYDDAVLVATTDGVGTKLRLAIETGLFDGIGQDLVAMCVNDLIVQGAEPLFFLDYFATGALKVEEASRVIASIARGCNLAGCALVGGETAEMPGMYHGGDFDLAGFSVGAAPRNRLLPKINVKAGDVILGLRSSGVHSNGYSLVRHILSQQKISLNDAAPFASGKRWAEVLLEPTRIYVKSCLRAIRSHLGVKALAHITGGGLTENLPRVLPQNTAAIIRPQAWEWPGVFQWLAEHGPVAPEEMRRTFNCGIGMAVVVEAAEADAIAQLFAAEGEEAVAIGEIVAAEGEPQVRYAN